MSARDEGKTHYFGDDCPGGHGAAVLAGVDTDDQLTPQEANDRDAADDAPAGIGTVAGLDAAAIVDLVERFGEARFDRNADRAGDLLDAIRVALVPVNAPAALDAVLRLHVADSYGNCCECGGEQDPQGAPWPCLTVRDIREALTEDGTR